MQSLACMRSLGATLTSAAATWALFVAANWGSAPLLTGTESFTDLLIVQAVIAVGFPFMELSLSFEIVMKVLWTVKRSLWAMKHGTYPQKQLDRGCIAIMTACPVFLEITHSSERLRQNLQSKGSYTKKEIESKWCPLELWLVAARTDEEINAVENATPKTGQPAPASLNQGTADGGRAVEKFIELTADADKIALFLAGLVPKYKELRYLRSRNRFQTIVTTLQAGGYMLGLLQRLVQHLDVSPLEALVGFHCLIVVLQLLMELYASNSYQRPLLLHLTPPQLSRLDNTLHTFSSSHNSKSDLSDRNENLIVAAVLNVGVVVMSVPLIYYGYHYVHVSRVSAVAVLLFVLSVIASTILDTTTNVSDSAHPTCKWDFKIPIGPLTSLTLSWVCVGVMSGGGVVLAVVGSIVEWHTFQQPVRKGFAWILPHASTST